MTPRGATLRRPRLSTIPGVCSAAVFAAAFVHSLWAVSVGWDLSLLQSHSFRQTQTAISVYWLMHGGPWLAYETPVLGPPWSIPIEFPLFQWIVALLASSTGAPLDQTGRLVSVAFFYLTLAPLTIILYALRIRRVLWPLALSAFLLSPIYPFWSRTFLIESFGLFLALSFLASSLLYLRTRQAPILYGAVAAAIAAAVVKFTILVPMQFIVGLLYLDAARSALIARNPSDWWRFLRDTVLLFALPLACLVAWTAYADFLKGLNPMGGFLTSSELRQWTFGTLQQRVTLPLWSEIWSRCLRDALGSSLVIVCFLFCLPFVKRRLPAIGIAAAAYLLSFLIFTNLHIVHNYYQYENAVLLLAVVVLCSADLLEQGGRQAAAGAMLLAALGLSSLYTYHFGPFLPLQRVEDVQIRGTAAVLKTRLAADQVFLLDGLGYNPEIPYYSERKAIMTPAPLDTVALRRSVDALPAAKLAAVGTCGPRLDRERLEQLMADLSFRADEMVDTGVCALYFGRVGTPMLSSAFRIPAGVRVSTPVELERLDGFSPDLTLSGFAAVEGPYPAWGMGQVRWGLGPASHLRIPRLESGARVVLKALSYLPNQTLKIAVNGKKAGEHTFAATGTFETLTIPIETSSSAGELELSYGSWEPGSVQDPRRRAVLFRCIQLVDPSGPLPGEERNR